MHTPLAYRMRPRTLDELVGQEDTLGPKSALYTLIQKGEVPSMLLYGPPGVGKTSTARAIAGSSDIHFIPLNKKVLSKKIQESGISEKTANLLANLTNSYDKAVEISQNEWFNGAKDVIEKWFVYLNKKDPQAFIYVQKNLLSIAKEKSQQQMILAILLYYFQLERDQMLQHQVSGSRLNANIEQILQCQQKLAANVPFQGVAEQLALRILFK